MPVKGARKCPSCGHMKKRPILVNSKTTQKYIKLTEDDFRKNEKVFKEMVKHLEPPYRVSFEFIRDSKRKFDYINAAQVVQDLMVKHEWIEDDNCDWIIPSYIPYSVDKENAGVIIRIIEP